MTNKKSLDAFRQRACEVAEKFQMSHWLDVASVLSSEGYPLAVLRMDLDTSLKQLLVEKACRQTLN
jgi:hypothetical protein